VCDVHISASVFKGLEKYVLYKQKVLPKLSMAPKIVFDEQL